MISIEHLSFTYNKTDFPALKDINLQIKKGEFILITGESGCGKTTLIRALNGLIPHFYGGKVKGTVQVSGKNPFKLGPRILSTEVGTVFQNSENQLFMRHVDSEIAFGMENLGYAPKEMEKQIHQVAEDLGFQDLVSREVTTLSGGEKQKVALASIIVMGADILLLDEPTSELDPLAARELMELLRNLNQKHNKTIIVTEHRLERVIDYINRIIVMEGGSVLADSTPKEILYNVQEARLFSPPLINLFQSLIQLNKIESLPLNLTEAKSALEIILQSLSIPVIQKPDRLPPPLSPPILELSDVYFKYPSSSTWVLQGVSLKIYPGQFIAIIGKNGSGKTTLLKHMNGLLRPQKGIIKLHNDDAKSKTVAQLSRDVGYIFQNPSIQFYQDNLYDELVFVLKNYEYKEEEYRELISECLSMFNLSQYVSRYGRFLSIGEQQRAALATVLLLKPSILVLDEPTHGMDMRQKTEFMNYLDKYRQQGNSVVLVTHDIETVAKYAARVVLLSEGMIIDDGDPHTILSTHEPFIPQINRLVKKIEGIPNWILTTNELLEVLRR